MPSNNELLAVIPARYGASRFPGKPLADLFGKPMVQHVWEQACQVMPSSSVVVATDDERIQQAAIAFGAQVVMTDSNHPSGTDRVWEVASQFPEAQWVMNIQGDEPKVPVASLKMLLDARASYPEADIITPVAPMHTEEEREDPNVVKAAFAHNGQALYFSRSPIPYRRDPIPEDLNYPVLGYRHLGVYLYKRSVLEQITKLPPSPLELQEKLEQLRAMEAGFKIYACVGQEASIGVDTPADLERIKVLFAS